MNFGHTKISISKDIKFNLALGEFHLVLIFISQCLAYSPQWAYHNTNTLSISTETTMGEVE